MAGGAIERFPNDRILDQLLKCAKLTTEHIIHDAYWFDKTYAEFLGDIVQMRQALRTQLPPEALTAQGLLHDERPYVCVLVLSGYEFLVAFFAIRTIGGACVPLASGILPEEASYFLSNTRAFAFLVATALVERAEKIGEYIEQHGGPNVIPNDSPPVGDVDIGIDESLEIDPQSPGYVLFTSGTSGPPKGAVLPKQCLAYEHIVEPNNSTLSFRPPHWMGGADSLLMGVITGMKLYILKERAGAEAFWEVLKNETITHCQFNPTMLRQLKEVYTDKLSRLPEEERQKYIDGFKRIARIRCGSAMISPTVLQFWTSISGRPFENIYGSTELGGVALETEINKPWKLHSVGVPLQSLAIDVKLSEGNHGEILVKSPWMLLHYISNEEATKKAFDEEGYFKTGDLAHIDDGEYIFEGRASVGHIFFDGYRIQILRVEEALANLPYVTEAYVVGVPDHEANELCGAVVRVKPGVLPREEISLPRIHADLSETLPACMRPYLLRVMNDGEEVPFTVSQKPIKREILKIFFGVTDYWSFDDPTPGVELCGNVKMQVEAEMKPWDWCGLQRSGDY